MDGPFGIAIPLDELRKQAQKEHPTTLTATPLAQAMDLTLAWQRTREPATLRPGDLAQERENLGFFPDAPVLIIWRLLDLEATEDRLIIEDAYRSNNFTLSHIDCLIARKVEGGQIVLVPHSLEMLEPYTGPREGTVKPRRRT